MNHPPASLCTPAPSALSRTAFLVLIGGSLAVSTGYGVLLLLPLYVVQLGGDESVFGLMVAAAALPTALVLGWLVRYPTRVRPVHLLTGSIAVYAAAAAAVAATSSLWVLAALGLVLGTAWAVVYAATTMTVSAMVSDARRATAFGYTTGSQQVGVGLGPILGAAFHTVGLPLPAVFLMGAALAAVGALVTAFLPAFTPADPASAETAVEQVPPFTALKIIVASAAANPLLMMMLLACLFATLTFFQPTFAAARHLNAGVFYSCFTVAVIVARFGFSRVLARADPARVTAWAMTLLSVSVAGFLVVGSNPDLYAAASVATGIGYGLALPLLQAQAVNLSPSSARARALPLAGLLFSSAILAFPVFAGLVIDQYGYAAIFVILLVFAIAQTTIAWLSSRRLSPRR